MHLAVLLLALAGRGLAAPTIPICTRFPPNPELTRWLKNFTKSWLTAPEHVGLQPESGVTPFFPGEMFSRFQQLAPVIGLNGVEKSVVAAMRELTVRRLHKQSLDGDTTVLDQALWWREIAFWLVHWFGAYVGHVLQQWPDQPAVTLFKQANGCFERYEMWSISHGTSWHYLAHVPFAQLRESLPAWGPKLCATWMKFYTDCYHGVGHGIIHSLIVSQLNASWYSTERQFFALELKALHHGSHTRPACCL